MEPKAPNRPQLFKNLFADQWLSGKISWDEISKQFGDQKVILSKNYYDGFGSEFSQYLCPLSDYVEGIRNGQKTDLMCTEQVSPTKMLHQITLPVLFGEQSNHGRTSYIFLGAKGNCSPLHFDWDFRNVFLHQVIGSKRVTVFPPWVSKRLFPISNTSTISISLMSDAERKHFVTINGGEEFIVNAGESIYMPKLCWHFVEYLEPSFSISFRYGSTRNERILATFPRNFRLQTLCSVCPDLLEPALEKSVFASAISIFFNVHYSPLERYRAFNLELTKLEKRHIAETQYIGEYLSNTMLSALLESKSDIEVEYFLNEGIDTSLDSCCSNAQKSELISLCVGKKIDLTEITKYFSINENLQSINMLEYSALCRAIKGGHGLPPFANFI